MILRPQGAPRGARKDGKAEEVMYLEKRGEYFHVPEVGDKNQKKIDSFLQFQDECDEEGELYRYGGKEGSIEVLRDAQMVLVPSEKMARLGELFKLRSNGKMEKKISQRVNEMGIVVATVPTAAGVMKSFTLDKDTFNKNCYRLLPFKKGRKRPEIRELVLAPSFAGAAATAAAAGTANVVRQSPPPPPQGLKGVLTEVVETSLTCSTPDTPVAARTGMSAVAATGAAGAKRKHSQGLGDSAKDSRVKTVTKTGVTGVHERGMHSKSSAVGRLDFDDFSLGTEAAAAAAAEAEAEAMSACAYDTSFLDVFDNLLAQ